MTPLEKKSHADPKPGTSSDVPETIEVAAGMFKNTCLALMDKVRDERTHILITKHGAPVARLVPADSEPASARGFMRGTVLGHGDIISPDIDAWGDI